MNKIPLEKLQQIIAESKTKAKSLWEPLWGKLTYNLAEGILAPLNTLSVSIEKGGLAIVYGSRFMSKIKIRGSRYYTVEEGKYLQPESFAKTVSLSIDELKARKTEVTLSIPREWTVIRTIELPSTVKENLATVISYELDRLTPLTSDGAMYDFKILGEKDGKLTIMIWAARANLISPYIEALGKEAIVVKKVTVGLSNLGTLSYYLTKNPAPVFLAHDRYGYQGGLVVEGSLVAVIGGLFYGEDKTTKAERVIADVNALIEMAKEREFSPKVLVYPDSGEQIVVENDLEVQVQILMDKEIQEKFYAKQSDIPCGAAGGMLESLWDKAKPLNLLGKGFQVTKKTPIVITIILLIIIAGLAAVYMMVPLQREEKILQEIDRQINARKEEVKKVESLKKEIDGLSSDIAAIKGFKDTKPMTLLIFKELTNLLPKTVWLTRTRISDTAVDIEGYANSATEIISKLEASQYFKKVEFASPTIRDTRLNADRFVIKMELEGIQKTEGDISKDGKKK
jgi:general secretion pathway protein L